MDCLVLNFRWIFYSVMLLQFQTNALQAIFASLKTQPNECLFGYELLNGRDMRFMAHQTDIDSELNEIQQKQKAKAKP